MVMMLYTSWHFCFFPSCSPFVTHRLSGILSFMLHLSETVSTFFLVVVVCVLRCSSLISGLALWIYRVQFFFFSPGALFEELE